MLSYSTPFSGYSFSYDARNRQTQAYVGAIPTGFLINGLGQRIAQMNGSVPQFYFVYDEAGHLSGKYDGGGNPLQETAWLGDLPVAVLQPSGRSYIAPDHLGSPHQITDSSGAVVWLWHPDPFGNGDPTGSFAYDLRFPGQFFDQATKLHYNYFRDYDPRTGRYIESDPLLQFSSRFVGPPNLSNNLLLKVPQLLSSYNYVFNSPVMGSDRYGLSPLESLEGLWETAKCARAFNTVREAAAKCRHECGDSLEDLAEFIGKYGSNGDFGTAMLRCVCGSVPEACAEMFACGYTLSF